MTKDEFATRLAKRTGLSKAKAVEAIDCIFGTDSGRGIIATELDAGRKVQLAGFGTFGSKSRAGRKGRNPATGEEIWIEAKKLVKFTPAKGLKDRVAD